MAEKEGMLGKWRNFSEITRNIGLGVLGLALLVGSQGVAVAAALSVVIDQAQIILIDSWKNRHKLQSA